MANGICTNCGLVNAGDHICSDDQARLMQIDREAGPRAVREMFLDLGKKGFGNKIETLETEAAAIRARLKG